jgi:plasmid stabilization system protein ParE
MKYKEESPCAFPIHRHVSQCRHFSVKNYIVLYHVIDQDHRVEIYRILRGSSDINNVIKSEDTQ